LLTFSGVRGRLSASVQGESVELARVALDQFQLQLAQRAETVLAGLDAAVVDHRQHAHTFPGGEDAGFALEVGGEHRHQPLGCRFSRRVAHVVPVDGREKSKLPLA
jgi:hypothetical protein